ncbi:hypothetical protein ABH901_001927, partial [Mammaliicoccus lentus]
MSTESTSKSDWLNQSTRANQAYFFYGEFDPGS